MKKHLSLALAILQASCLLSCNGRQASAEQSASASQTADTLASVTLFVDTLAADTLLADTLAEESPTAQAPQPPVERRPSTYRFRPGRVVQGKLIALTFDDGPNTKSTPKILATLRKYNAVATFFCVGRCINTTTTAYLRQAVNMGCEVCSHTWDHPFLSTLNYEQTQVTIDKTNQAIKRAVGYYPNFYRPPYIDADQTVLNNIDLPAASGSGSDDWRVDHTPEMIAQTVMQQACPGAIIVMHDFGPNTRTPVALETIIPRLQQQGYKFVTITDLFTSAGVKPRVGKMYKSPTSTYVIKPENTYRERRKHKAASPSKPAKAEKSAKPTRATKAATPAAKAKYKVTKAKKKTQKKTRKVRRKRR